MANGSSHVPGMTSLAPSASRMSTISYGKERPAVVGSSEESYAQNRRAVTVAVQQVREQEAILAAEQARLQGLQAHDPERELARARAEETMVQVRAAMQMTRNQGLRD